MSEDITIEEVEAIGIQSSLEEPLGYAQGWTGDRASTLVRIKASDGTVGWGESWRPVEGTPEQVESVFGPHIVGENPLAVERLYDRLYDIGRATYQTVVPLPAISGIDIALWDLAGKILNQPVSMMLGGRRRDQVRPYATGHYFPKSDDLDEIYEKICKEATHNAEKFGALKLKTGLDLVGYGTDEDIELVRRVRDTVGPDPEIMVDGNYAYNRNTARRVGRALESLDIQWFEEPLQPEEIDGYRTITRDLDVPIACGESHTPAEFNQLFTNDGIDIAQPSLSIVGGLTPARRIMCRAQAHGVPVVPHVWGTPVVMAASLQLISTLDWEPWLEFDQSSNPLRTDIAEESFKVEDGHVDIPKSPGLGIELDEAAIKEYRVN